MVSNAEIITENKQKKSTRNSSIELLKIIAIILIVISHSVPEYGDTNSIGYINVGLSTTNITNFILAIFRNLGNIGNIIFIICSAYFLIDLNKTKKEKIINIVIDSFIISITFLVITLISGFNIPAKDIIKQFFPITFANNWFIGCYLLFYAAHPLLNIIIRNLSQKQLLKVNLILLFLYSVIRFFLVGKFEYNAIIGFIMIYFIVAYVKLYMSKFQKNKRANIIILLGSILLFLMMLILVNFLGLKIKFLSNKLLYWNSISNMFFICIGITIFNLFNNKNFKNKFINYCSSLSLVIYLIHENILFKTYIRPLFYNTVFNYGHILLWVILEAIILFVGATILAAIYKETAQRITVKLSKKIGNIFVKYYSKIESKLLQIN